MARFLISFTNGSGEFQAVFHESPGAEGAPDPILHALKSYNQRIHRRWMVPPTFAYTPVERTSTEATCFAHRETPDGNLLFAGAVHCAMTDEGEVIPD